MSTTKTNRVAGMLEKFDPIELGEKVGVTRQTVWAWQNGRALPGRYYLKLISEATGLLIDELRAARQADWVERRAVV